MLFAICLALALITMSTALVVGPQLAVYGPKALPALAREAQVRFAVGCLTSVAALGLVTPHFGAALVGGGQAMALVMLDVYTMSFGLI